jgi:PAS domain S-box-containing protein
VKWTTCGETGRGRRSNAGRDALTKLVAPLGWGLFLGYAAADRYEPWHHVADAMATLALGTVILAWPLTALLRPRGDAALGGPELEDVMELTRTVVFDVADDGITVEHVTGNTVELLGWQPEELVGRGSYSLLHPDESGRIRAALDAAASGARCGWSDEPFRIFHADGTTVWVTACGAARFDADGEHVGYTVTARPCDDRAGIAVLERAAAARRIEGVLTTDRPSIAFQPLISAKTCRVVGVEALCRFAVEPERAPDAWFAEAHHVGRGIELELLAMSQALDAAQELPDDLYVSINVSPATLLDPRLHTLVCATWLPLPRLVLEVTEHLHIEDYEPLCQQLVGLRGRGVRIAVDDAGAGFASLQHIVRLEPDIIKLDRGLVAGIDDDPQQRALAAALVMFASEVGSTIVAEGIETPGEMAAVIALGVETLQGYGLGRPTQDREEWARWENPTRSRPAPVRPTGTLQPPQPYIEV